MASGIEEFEQASSDVATFLGEMLGNGINPDIWMICGAVGTEPEDKQLPSGTEVVNFRIVHNKYKGKNRDSEERWFGATAFGDLAQDFRSNVVKGDIVILLGEWDEPSWVGADGQKRTKTVQTFHKFWIYKKKDRSEIREDLVWPYDSLKESIDTISNGYEVNANVQPAAVPINEEPKSMPQESVEEPASSMERRSALVNTAAEVHEDVSSETENVTELDEQRSSEELRGQRLYLTTKLGNLIMTLGMNKDEERKKIEMKYQCSIHFLPLGILETLVSKTEGVVKYRRANGTLNRT